jgi:hypothetical protein
MGVPNFWTGHFGAGRFNGGSRGGQLPVSGFVPMFEAAQGEILPPVVQTVNLFLSTH